MQKSEQPFPELELQKPIENDCFDVTIIGAGPAGLSAAICANRAKLNVLLLEKAIPGGGCTTACKIDNLVGYPDGILGVELAQRMEKQAFSYPLTYHCETVTDILNIDSNEKIIKTDLGNTYKSKAIILALGLEPKQLEHSFATRFLGRGVSYYAQGDFESYQNEDVVVYGGGNCACYAADYLAKVVKKVYLVHPSDAIKAVQSLKDAITSAPNIDIIWNSVVADVFGIDHLEKIKIEHTQTHQSTWLDAKALFVYIGRRPSKEIISPEIECDENGYIITDEGMRTNIRGIYAVGDIRNKQIRQIATAISDGMLAAVNIERDILR